MSFTVFLPLLIFLGIFLVPIWLLRNQRSELRQDTFVSPGYTPPQAIRNSSISYSLRVAAFGPLFAFGAAGNFWPAILGAACSGLGIYLIYVLRRHILAFLQSATGSDQSVTVHAFIARQHGGDPHLRVFAASLTLFVLVAALACEAFAMFGFFSLVFGNETVARALAFGVLLLAAVYALPAGHLGVMYSGQLQLGAIFLGLFGATAFLLYLHVSALTPLPRQGAFAIAFSAASCLAILVYRRSRYIETGPIGPGGRIATLLSKFGKTLNPVISIFAVLIIVLAAMELSANGFPLLTDAAGALQTGSSLPLMGLASLMLLPLFYPLADIVYWQRLAALENNRPAYESDTAGWRAALRGTFRVHAAELPLLWLFITILGAMTVAALALADGADALQALAQEVAAGDNPIASGALSFLLLAVVALALSTMASSFSAGLCTIRYDLWPAPAEAPSNSMAGRTFFLAVILTLILLVETLPMAFTSSSFLALLFALCSPVLSLVPLILGPFVTGRGIGKVFAMLVLSVGGVSTAVGVAGFVMTGSQVWLWSTAPAALAAGFLLFALGSVANRHGSRMR